MDYELAKELEDAGFPQGGQGSFVVPPDKIVVRREDRVYCPTLSELIEACGGHFGILQRIGLTKWIAHGAPTDARPFYGDATGSSAEEAVARLWLALIKMSPAPGR
jgi:hypothetical protein